MNKESTLVRKLIHNLRNNLNGMNIESMFLKDIIEDEDGVMSVERINTNLSSAEQALQATSIRLSAPESDIAAAVDVFRQWQSGSKKLKLRGQTTWQCELSAELINVDMRQIALALCELLPASEGESAVATATFDDGGVRFSVSRSAGCLAREHDLPGFEDVIRGNGGNYDNANDVVSCWFPIVSCRI
jgi:hypothetical protein